MVCFFVGYKMNAVIAAVFCKSRKDRKARRWVQSFNDVPFPGMHTAAKQLDQMRNRCSTEQEGCCQTGLEEKRRELKLGK
jgi:hypothetical protein